MSIINLIKNLDNTEKTNTLGETTTKILRYTFVKKDTDAVAPEIINQAVAAKDGTNYIYKKKKRDILVESIRQSKLTSLGYENYESAISTYDNNIELLFSDFQIEDEYRIKNIKDNRTNIEVAKPIYGECNGSNAFPHPYQLRLKHLILKELEKNLNNRLLVTMPTGAGKTVLAMESLVDIFRNFNQSKPLQVVWVVDSKELSEQSFQSFQKIWKQKGDREVVAQRYFDRFKILNAKQIEKITFASFDLLTPRISSDDPDAINLLRSADVIFIDEAHVSNAQTYREVLVKYKELNSHGKLIGLTATPYRNDDTDYESLKGMFHSYLELTNSSGEKVKSPMGYLIERGYLADIDFEILNTERSSESNSEYYRNLHESVKRECNNIIEAGKNTIIFAESKSHAIALNLYLNHNNVENELIIGDTHPYKRKEYLEKFGDKNDSLSVIVNHQILSTGIDVPGMNSIMILSSIQSPTLALQIIGRAMRGKLNGGNPRNTIYLTKDNENKLKDFSILEDRVLRT